MKLKLDKEQPLKIKFSELDDGYYLVRGNIGGEYDKSIMIKSNRLNKIVFIDNHSKTITYLFNDEDGIYYVENNMFLLKKLEKIHF